MSVKLVTDSSCDLPRELAQEWAITVIPCYINFGDETFRDVLDLSPDEFYTRLVSSPNLPTTSQPTVHDFLQAYGDLSGQGHDVVSIHLSTKFSGTLNSAIQAKNALDSDQQADKDTPRSIEIIDSRMTSMGLGLVVLAAARMVKDGASSSQVVEGIHRSLSQTHCYFLLDTLEYLQKGGRIGKASAFLGSLLSIKPILMIRDGEAHPVERVRTRERGLRRLVETIKGLSPITEASILYTTTLDEAESLRDRLSDLLPAQEFIMARFGPVVGTYLGPGALGVGVVCPS